MLNAIARLLSAGSARLGRQLRREGRFFVDWLALQTRWTQLTQRRWWWPGLLGGGLLILLVLWLQHRPPKVLVLQSYALDYSWSVGIDKGLHRVLDRTSYEVRWHFMDTKRNPSAEAKDRAGELARAEIEAWQPDLLIAVDDNAQAYVAKHYVDDPRMQIVFSGVNNEARDYGYDRAKNVTGMLERLDYLNIKNVLYHLLPMKQGRFVYVSEASSSGVGVLKELQALDWTPLQFKSSTQAKTFDEWKAAITQAATEADLIVFTQYHTILRSADSPEVMPPKELIQWFMQHSKLPGIGFFPFYVEDGGILSFGPSPYEHGEAAAKMAVRILDENLTPSEIPVSTNSHFIITLRNKDGKITSRPLEGLDLSLIYDAYALLAQ